MTETGSTAEDRYTAVVAALADRPGVTHDAEPGQPRGRFGGSALKVGGKIFAMLSQGSLVVKLPRGRVDALVASGDGVRFDPRRDGRVMKEWVSLAPESGQDWLALAEAALEFVSPASR